MPAQTCHRCCLELREGTASARALVPLAPAVGVAAPSTLRAQAGKPLELWLTGGPGCSSLSGMFGELGPLVIGEDMHVSSAGSSYLLPP